jgi:hypothetical protein
MNTIQLDWESPAPEEWSRRLAACGRSTLFQSWGWGAALSAVEGLAVRRAYILKNGRPVGLLQVVEERQLGLFTLGKVLRGPLFHQPVMPEERVAALRQAARLYPLTRLKRFSVLPELPDGPAARGLMEAGGFTRAMAGYETAWLDLSVGEDALRAGMRQNFRNQLRRAETAAPEVREETDPRPLLAEYDRHRTARRYAAPSGSVLAALPEDETLTLAAYEGGAALSGVLFALHGRAATYQVGWTSEAGRAVHAHNLLLWQGLQRLAARGIRHLDLGGMERDTAPGVAHFKDGLGGEPFFLPGTYV